jgi:hypothetical protein
MLALKPERGKPAFRNFRESDGNGGIIRSPLRAIALPDYRKGSSESILASSLAGAIARYHLKRRQRYWWAGLLSFEKPMEQDADSIPSGGRQHDNHVNREWIVRSCVVLEPAHAEKQHAREPGYLPHALVSRARPVREGHKPNCGHERTGEVGLCRSTSEPAEQRRAVAFGGGRGGKGTD